MTKLFVKHASTGVYGRILLHLTRGTRGGGPAQDKDKDDEQIKAARRDAQQKLRVFSPGDIVGLF